MKNKHYPIDNSVITNKRKWVGAYVWYKGQLMRITSQNVGLPNVVVNNLHKVSKNQIRLAKIGQAVEFKDLSILPDRCSEIPVQQIVRFLSNDLITLSADNDSTNFGHLKAA